MNTALVSVICGLISATSAIVVCIINNTYNNSLIAYRIEQLEKKMDKHNSIIDRVYQLEKDMAVVKEHLEENEK